VSRLDGGDGRGGVDERVIAGRRCTNRRGAAEYLQRSLQMINLVASPKRRSGTGWPAAAGTVDGQEWYALEDLDAFRVSYIQAKEHAGRARVHQVALAGDPAELLTATQFRALIAVEHNVWSKYVAASRPAWERGEDGYLSRPDAEEPARHGVLRSWRRHRVQEWINNRRGSAPSPGRPRLA